MTDVFSKKEYDSHTPFFLEFCLAPPSSNPRRRLRPQTAGALRYFGCALSGTRMSCQTFGRLLRPSRRSRHSHGGLAPPRREVAGFDFPQRRLRRDARSSSSEKGDMSSMPKSGLSAPFGVRLTFRASALIFYLAADRVNPPCVAPLTKSWSVIHREAG